jgi:hypothetical protein
VRYYGFSSFIFSGGYSSFVSFASFNPTLPCQTFLTEVAEDLALHFTNLRWKRPVAHLILSV